MYDSEKPRHTDPRKKPQTRDQQPTIRRAARRQRYLIVDQSAVEDSRLSWAARGLLAYLLSRPDDWRVYVSDLIKRGNLGRDGIYSLLRELRNTGYLHYQRRRDKQGRMRGGTYTVSELPVPHPALPDTAEPDPVPPDTAEPGALTTTDSNELITTTTTPTDTYGDASVKFTGAPLHSPDWLSEDLVVSARELLQGLAPVDAEIVATEWLGALEDGVIRSSPLGYLSTLIKRYQAGEMSLRYARP